MARTLPVYEMDAETGQTGIYLVDPATPTDRAPFLNPTAYARYVLFHSALEFMRVSYDQSITINFPSATGLLSTTREWPLPAHNLAKIPFATLAIGSNMILPGQIIQVGSEGASRSLSLKLTASGVAVVERVSKWFQSTLPAMSAVARVVMIDQLPSATSSDKFKFDMTTGEVMFGYGRFSNNGPDLIKGAKTATGIEFTIPKIGPTLDTENGAVRHVSPTGAMVTMPGYDGTFTGSGGWPVKT